MNDAIHPTAIVHPSAKLGTGIRIDPYAIVEEDVVIGDGSVVRAHAVITARTVMGRGNDIHMGAVLGHFPQDKAFDESTVKSRVRLGDANIIREYATIHRSSRSGEETVVGDGCFLMAHAHLGHDCRVGDEVIVGNNTCAGGYVTIDDKTFVSANVVIHQFVRIGTLCMLGGQCGVGQDVPPYTTITDRSLIRGLNVVGLRRAEVDSSTRRLIKQAYRDIFAKRGDIAHAVSVLDGMDLDLPELRCIHDFYAAESKRKYCWPAPERGARDGRRQ